MRGNAAALDFALKRYIDFRISTCPGLVDLLKIFPEKECLDILYSDATRY